MKTLAERLVWARTQKGLSQSELAKLAGVSQSTIGNLESGLRLSARRIANIADALGVAALWLAEGVGEISARGQDGGEMDDIAYRIDQARTNAITDNSPNFMKVKMAVAGSRQHVHIKKVRLRLSAGLTGFQVDPDFEDGGTITLDPSWVTRQRLVPDRLVAIAVKGESMEPALYEGDVVVINTADTKLVDGEVYAVNYEGEAVVKRLLRDSGDWWLASDNQDQRKYSRKRCRSGECIIIGRIVHRQGNRI